MFSIMRPLPSVFRIASTSHTEPQSTVHALRTKFMPLVNSGNSHPGTEQNIGKLTCLDWYPGERCWQMECTPWQLRKQPELNGSTRSFTACQFWQRGEAGSSVSFQSFYSMCSRTTGAGHVLHPARTTQLVEAIMASASSGTIKGGVVANDANIRRAYTFPAA